MTKIPLPFTDAFLLLTPASGGRLTTILLLILAPAALVMLYRYELRLVKRSAAAFLLALRLAVLVFLLFVVGFQPIVGRSVGEELPGRVLIAVDRSASMDITDPQRPAADKLRLARALKLAEDLGGADQLTDWIHQYETEKSPAFLNDPDSHRRYDEICRRVDALTRTQISRKLLTAEGLRLVEAIAARHRVEVQGFDQEAWDIPPERVEELFASEAVRPADKRNSTDLRLPLLHALEQKAGGEEKLLGVVLLTDGRHNWGPSPVAKAIELGQRSVPIYPIALGAAQAPPDVAVAAVKTPPAVFKNVDVPIEARVKISGLPRQEVIVELQRPGQEPLQEPIAHDGKDGYHTVRFQVKLDQVGAQPLTVSVKPITGEIRTDNNSRTTVVNVADDKAKVLLIDGEARWEYHYLANALARDPSVKLRSILFAQPRVGLITEEQLQKIGNPARTWPEQPDALADYDCIILGDVSPGQLPLGERTRLEHYVADRGGTLIVVAGKRWMPLAFARPEDRPAAAAADGDPLLKLLPIQNPEVVRPVRGFPVALTAEGRLTPFLQLGATAAENPGDWAKLPEHYWGAVGKTKPGATALAVVPGDEPGPETARTLIARHHYGFGRVLYLGLESTWRWRYKVGDTLHHRFWGQVVRWAAADKPLVAGNDRVRFGTRDPVYQQGQQVDVVVRLGEEVRPPGAGALAGVRILRQTAPGKEEAVALVPLAPREAQPRVLEGRLRDLPAGQYAVELVIPDLADQIGNAAPGAEKPRATFTVTAPDSEEMVELSANQPLLEELAVKSGGKVFGPENTQELVDLLTHQASVRWHHTETRLWEWWPTLGLFLLLLTVEWVVRKWAGLP